VATFEREQDRALYEVKEFLVSIISNAPYGVLAFDLEGEVIMTNALAVEYLGKKMSVNHAVGKNIMELTDHVPELATAVVNCLERGREPFDLPPVQINRQFILIKGRLISDGTIIVIEDVTAQKEAEMELAEANSKLQELDRMKSMFIASMSHELRTPLNSILGFTGLILQGISGKIDGEAKDDLHIVYDAAKHLLSLINDVIDISKIEAARFEVYFEDVQVDELLKEAVTITSKEAEEKGLEVKMDVPDGLHLISDKKRLLQCVLNLMSNAVKFTEKGSIALRAVKKADVLEISVRDTGIGIKKEDIAKLFHSFVRLDSPLKSVTMGTGLGLYLTHKIVNGAFNGDIRVESKYGRGSTFTLIIPVRAAHAPGVFQVTDKEDSS
jgi:signal transduction histidine kinase